MHSSQSTSWQRLRMLRRRGQKPALPVLVSDHLGLLDDTGVLALSVPTDGDEELLTGLDVVAMFDKNDRTVEVAQRLASAAPASLAIIWRGADLQRVLP